MGTHLARGLETGGDLRLRAATHAAHPAQRETADGTSVCDTRVSPALRIAIAGRDEAQRHDLAECLSRLGHEVVIETGSRGDLVARCQGAGADVVVADVALPDPNQPDHVWDGIDIARELSTTRPTCVLLLAPHYDEILIRRAEKEEGACACLFRPVKLADLEAAIRISAKRCGELFRLRQDLAHRKIIERAKGVLMKWNGLDEDTAHHELQRLARQKNRKLFEVAEMVLIVAETQQSLTGRDPAVP